MSETTERISNTDIKEPGEVGLYLFELIIDGSTYGGHIPAKSWEEAQSKVETFGAKIYGLSQEFISDRFCSICSGEITKDTSKPLPIETDSFFDDNEIFE